MIRHRHASFLAKILLDLGVLTTALCLAFLLRFDGAVPSRMFGVMWDYLPLVLLSKMSLLAAGGRWRSTWRHTSLRDTVSIFNLCSAATVLLLAWRLFADLQGARAADAALIAVSLPIGVILLDLVLSFLGLVGLRGTVRLLYEHRERRLATVSAKRVPTLLIGAGRAGAMAAKEIASRPDLDILPVGFLDDDAALTGMHVGGIPVLGTTAELAPIAKRFGVQHALITIAQRSGNAVRKIFKLCKANGLDTKIIPSLHEIVEGRINLTRIRKVALEDLLRRPSVQLDCDRIRELVQNQTVLVTGAGGSIGSELCRSICDLSPKALLLVERAENSLFQTHLRLSDMFPSLRVVPCIADICDEDRMETIFCVYRPSLVFHAAAHKHVPMMEWNPSEAAKNNVLGTRTVATLADAWGVERFVMISTDKAVNPASVMGVSKRVAELWVQAFSTRSTTRFMTVRFGNVLGSNGSVIPIFQQQILQGGPVTVTHPEMKRYFMTIPEACQLVLQAATMGAGGEIFILDMGEPVRILDIARDLIQLSGLSPDHDMEIRFTGIRPGEKLFEELFLGEEQAQRTRHPRIFIGQGVPPDWDFIDRHVLELGTLAINSDMGTICAKFKDIVPEYNWASARPEERMQSHDPMRHTVADETLVELNGRAAIIGNSAPPT
jgi:FlaA1/EpsC-like NDP-sugar epimerase